MGGEEEGLLGSTEWAEAHADELRAHAAVYVNSDGNGRGYSTNEWLAIRLEQIHNTTASPKISPILKRTTRHSNGCACSGHSPNAAAPRIAKEDSQTRRSAHRSARFGLGLHRRSWITSALRRSIWATAARMVAAFTIPSTTIFIGTPISPTRIFRYGTLRWPETIGTVVMPLWPMPTCCPTTSPTSPTPSRSTPMRLDKLWKSKSDEINERNKELEEGVFSAIADPKKTLATTEDGGCSAVLELRAVGARRLRRSCATASRTITKRPCRKLAAGTRSRLLPQTAVLAQVERAPDAAGRPARPPLRSSTRSTRRECTRAMA